MTKLQDINPLLWAQNAVYANTGSGEPWRTGSAATKVAPPVSIYAEGVVPKAALPAEYENYIRNQTSNLESTLAFDRMGDIRYSYSTASNTPHGPACYDTLRKTYFGVHNPTGTSVALYSYDSYFEPIASVKTLATATTGGNPGYSEIAYHASTDTYEIGFINGAWEIVNASTLATTTGTLAASVTFSRLCRPHDSGTGRMLFAGVNSGGFQCIVACTGSAFVTIALPSNVTAGLCRFHALPNGRLWFMIEASATCFYSDDAGTTWTVSTGTRTDFNYKAAYDPDNGIWVAAVGSGSSTVPTTVIYTTPAAIPNVSLTAVKTINQIAVQELRQFGSYCIALVMRIQFIFGGTYTPYWQVMGSRDYGRSWHAFGTVLQGASTGLVDVTLTNAALTNAALRMRLGEDGWYLHVLRSAGPQYQFLNPLSQQDTTFA